MEKALYLSDASKSKDNASIYNTTARRTDIFIRDLEGKLLFRTSNLVTIGGSEFTIYKHFDLPVNYITPSYNEVLGLDNSEFVQKATNSGEFIYLFCVGDGGCGELNSNVYPVDYSKWIQPDNLIPFRYQIDSEDLTGELRDKYFGRKTLGDTSRVAYYFKGFESTPVVKRQYIDGTPIDDTIYEATKDMEVEAFVELNMKVTKEDCRDFFIATAGIEAARINQLSLCSAYYTVADGIKYFQNIRPVTQLNIPNESLIDLTKGLDITYHIYY